MTTITLITDLGGHKAGVTLDVTPGVADQLIANGHAESLDGDAGGTNEPPRSGKGSGVDKWKLYAESKGLTVLEDADRDAIIELVEASVVPID